MLLENRLDHPHAPRHYFYGLEVGFFIFAVVFFSFVCGYMHLVVSWPWCLYSSLKAIWVGSVWFFFFIFFFLALALWCFSYVGMLCVILLTQYYVDIACGIK